jgi:flagellar motor switch protein FliG
LVESVAKEFLEKAAPPKKIENKDNEGAESPGDDIDDRRENNLKAIQAIPPDLLIQLIQNEHPQTISLILAYLQPHIASEVMALLPDEMKPDVAYRIANLDKVASGMLEEIDNVLKKFFPIKRRQLLKKPVVCHVWRKY